MSAPPRPNNNLPQCVTDYINLVIKKIRYRRKVRKEVRTELVAHFTDALADCKTQQEKENLARQLIADFGDPKLLACLIRRGKKRCRPLWKKAVIRTLQGFAVLLICFIVRGTYLSMGTPKISVDYLDWINKWVSEGKDESLNAKPYFDKAIEIADTEWPMPLRNSKHKWWGDMNSEVRDVSIELLSKNAKAFEFIREGVQKPDYWNEYKRRSLELELQERYPRAGYFNKFIDSGNTLLVAEIVNDTMQYLSPYRKLARQLAMEVERKVYEQNDASAAIKDALVIQKFGMFQQGKGLLVEQLVGIGIEALGQKNMSLVLDKTDVPATVLKQIQEELLNEYKKHDTVIDLDAEKAFWYDYVQRAFTDDGKGGGKMLPQGLPLAIKDMTDMLRGFVLGYPDRRAVLAGIDNHFGKLKELNKKTPWQLQQESYAGAKEKIFTQDSLLLSISTSALIRSAELAWRVKAARNGLLSTLSLLRFKKETGPYPQDLKELLNKGYLNQLPDDPYSDGILKYQRRGDDFILYSVGADFDDDGGIQDADNDWGQGEPGGKEGGDRVFWPVD